MGDLQILNNKWFSILESWILIATNLFGNEIWCGMEHESIKESGFQLFSCVSTIIMSFLLMVNGRLLNICNIFA